MTDATQQPENGGAQPGPLSRFSAAEWIAILGVLVLAISFIWEWGYWGAFGVSLAEIPMSLENLASAILAWVPALWLPVLMFVGGFYLGYGDGKGAKARELYESFRSAGLKKEAFVISLAYGILPLVSAILVLFLLAVSSYHEQGILPLFAWILVVSIAGSLIWRKYNFSIIFAVFVALAMSSYVYIQARSSSFWDIDNPSAQAWLHVMTDGAVEKKKALILRNNHDFIFAYEFSAEKLTIIPWRMVLSVEFDSVPEKAIIRIPFLYQDSENQE